MKFHIPNATWNASQGDTLLILIGISAPGHSSAWAVAASSVGKVLSSDQITTIKSAHSKSTERRTSKPSVALYNIEIAHRFVDAVLCAVVSERGRRKHQEGESVFYLFS